MWQWLSAVPADPTSISWSQLGIAGIVCALLVVISWLLWLDNKKKDATIATLQEARISDRDSWLSREQERMERFVPVMSEAIDMLGRLPERFDRAIGQAQSAWRSDEAERLVSRMRDALDHIERREQGH